MCKSFDKKNHVYKMFKRYYSKVNQVRIVSLFEVKDLHLVANLLELSHINSLVRIASLIRRNSSLKGTSTDI